MIKSQGLVTVSGLTLVHSLGGQTPSGTEVLIWGQELEGNFSKGVYSFLGPQASLTLRCGTGLAGF